MATAQHIDAGPKPKIEGVGYDRLVTFAGIWLLLGLFVDGWAHINQPQLETFFTPWHAILYSGALALGSLIVGAVYLNQQRGYVKLSEAIPRGYRMSMIGVPVFFIGAVGDLLWHEIFGIEVSIEALLSPTHLLLALGGILMAGGPMRAAWFRADDPDQPIGWVKALPVLLSVALLTAVLGFFTMYVNPFARVTSSAQFDFITAFPALDGELAYRVNQSIMAFGLGGVLVYSAILSAALQMVAKRFRILPFGGLTLLVALPVVLQVVIRHLPGGPFPYIGAGILGGLAADLLYARYRASGGSVVKFRLLAAGAPLALFTLYFLAVQIFGGGIWWTVHLWTGAAATAGVVGWGMSYLVWQPEMTP